LVRECQGVVETEVERVLAAELRAETTPNDEPDDPTWIVVRCHDGRVIIEVSDGISRKTVKRNFDLSASSSEGRGRLIAIAASELVLASWAELALRPKLRVEPEGEPPSAARLRAAVERARPPTIAPAARWPSEESASGPATEPSREARPRSTRSPHWFALQPSDRRMLRLVPLASARSFFAHDGALWGGGLRVGEERLVTSAWSLDALIESGKINGFHIDSYTLGAQLYLYTRSRYFTVRGGAGLRAGITSSVGDPGQESASVLTPWGWPMLAFSGTIGAKGEPILELSGEAGYVTLPVTLGRHGMSIRGPWFALQVGFGFAP
jgi:hypothetical protein